jgi:hypothetical protein
MGTPLLSNLLGFPNGGIIAAVIIALAHICEEESVIVAVTVVQFPIH